MPRYVTTCVATSRNAANTEDIFFEASAAYARIVAIYVHFGNGSETSITEEQFVVRFYSATTAGSGGTNTNTTMDGTSHFITANGTANSSVVSVAIPMNSNASAAQATIKVKSGTTNFTAGAGTNKLMWTEVKNIREQFSYISRDEHYQPLSNSSTAFWVTIASPNASGRVFTVVVVHEE